jgi:hypothetical protein
MSEFERRQNADGAGSANAPPIVVIAEDWATSQRRARATRLVVLSCALLAIAAFLAPRLMGTGDVRAAASIPPPAQASTLVATALSDVRIAPPGAFSVSAVPNAVATLETRGIRVRRLTADEVAAAGLENVSNAWLVANLAPDVSTLAIDDIILGQCAATHRTSANAPTAPLPICFVRDGQVYMTTL